jgi:hypothetical protein
MKGVRIISAFYFFIFIILFPFEIASAQENNSNIFSNILPTYNPITQSSLKADPVNNKTIYNQGYWLSLGIGKNYFGPALNFSLSYSYDNNVFTVKFIKANEFTFSPGGYDFNEPLLKLEEIGALYGKIYREGYILLSLSGGISYVYGINRGKQIQSKEYEKIKISTLGIPFEANFRIEINSFLGIGASCFGNLNNQKTYLGGMVQIYIGKF